MIAVLLFVAILAILILVHEFGHFFVAKRSGARVEEFGIGFPPRVLAWKKGETAYSLNLFPIGGFVKIYGEDGEKKDDPRSFASKSIGMRAFIVVAGVLMNIALAIVLFSAGHSLGLPQVLDDDQGGSTGSPQGARVKNITVRIVSIAKGSPAEVAEVQIGDVIWALKSADAAREDIENIKAVQEFIGRFKGEKIALFLKRGNEIIEKNIVPRANPPEGEGALGIAMARIGVVSYPFYLAPLKGVESTALFAWGTIKAFGEIVADFLTSGQVSEGLAGPIGIAVMSGEAQKMGFLFLLQFVALISINLAIINVLPFPALDGGRLLFLLIEKIKGSPVRQKYEKIAHTVGFALLILLMILITFRDIGKFL